MVKKFALNLTSCTRLHEPSTLWKAVITALLLSVPGMLLAQVKDSGKIAELPPVVVTAIPFKDRSDLDMTQPVTVLQGEDLRRKRESSIGDTLT